MYELGSPPKSILESMELVRLPSPPHILSTLLDVCHDPDSSTADLAELISADPSLTSKLIMAVNSTAFAVDQPVNSLEEAIALTGRDLVKTMVVTSSIQQLFAGLIDTQKELVCNIWLDALYCAVFARDIAIALDYEHPQDAYMAGLLHDIGQTVFDAKYHEQYVKIFDSETEAETIAREHSKYGLNHTELGAGILEQWSSLGPAVADAVRFHHEEEELLNGCDILCQIVAEASQLAWQWTHYGKADTRWQSSLVDEEDLKRIFIHVKDKMAQVAARHGIGLPKSRTLTHDDLSRHVEKETIQLARKIRDASLIKVINTEETHSPILNSPQALLAKAAREMQLFFSISDLALLFHDPADRDSLTLYQINLGGPAAKFSVDNRNSQAIRSFIERRRLWIEPENPDHKASPISDRQIIRRLRHDIALSCPITYEGEILGTIVIGAHATQRNNLDKLSHIISSYLKNLAETWLRHSHDSSRKTMADNARKEHEQRDIDKLIHEISNPLSIIGNYIDIVQQNSKSDGGENSEEIAVLKEELQRVRNIVLNFKDAKSAESPAVYLNAELETCIPLYVKSTADDKEVQIMWSLDETDSEIDITQDALRQIVLNLVKNAVEAQTDDAAIMVASRHFVNIDGKTFAQFSISDRGRGVDKKTRELLFSPLTSTKEGAGRGLGLSVVAEILGKFNGQIKYMKNEVGGALFEVLIPLSTNQ